MKIILLIAACLLFSCSNNNKNVSEDIIVKTTFESILKDIHLAESLFEMNKNKNPEMAKIKLNNAYLEIYQKNQISKKEFDQSLDYYCENPKILEKIYNNILEQLKKEKASLDRQQTN